MRFAKHLVFAFLLLGAARLPAAAQDAFGKFTVSHETRWGTAMLPAGSYTVALRSGPAPLVIITSDTRSSLSVLAIAQYVEEANCKASSLELEQNAGIWDVRSLCFASSVAVHFASLEKMNPAAATPQVASLAGSN